MDRASAAAEDERSISSRAHSRISCRRRKSEERKSEEVRSEEKSGKRKSPTNSLLVTNDEGAARTGNLSWCLALFIHRVIDSTLDLFLVLYTMPDSTSLETLLSGEPRSRRKILLIQLIIVWNSHTRTRRTALIL